MKLVCLSLLLVLTGCRPSFQPPSGTAEWDEDVIPNGVENEEILGVSGSASDDIWAVTTGHKAYHFDGRRWAEVHFQGISAGWRGVQSLGRNDVWAVGNYGYVAHFDGENWSVEQPAAAKSGPAVNRVQAYLDIKHVMAWPGEIWIDAGGGIRKTADGWSKIPRQGASVQFDKPWGANPKDVWTNTDHSLARFDGQKWTEVRPPAWAEGDMYTVLHGSAANDVWFKRTRGAADDAILHFDGRAAELVPLPRGARVGAVFAVSPSQAWMADSRGGLLKWDGKSWRWSPHGRRVWTILALFAPVGGKAIAAGFPGDRVLREK